MLPICLCAHVQGAGVVLTEWNTVIVIEEHREQLKQSVCGDFNLDDLPVYNSIKTACQDVVTDKDVATFFGPITTILGSQQ